MSGLIGVWDRHVKRVGASSSHTRVIKFKIHQTVSPQERALAKAKLEQQEEEERTAAGEEQGGRGGGRFGRGRGRGCGRWGGSGGRGGREGRGGGGRQGRGGGDGRGFDGRQPQGDGQAAPAGLEQRSAQPPPPPQQQQQQQPGVAGDIGAAAAPRPAPRNRYEQRFDRPFLVAVPRAVVAPPAAAASDAPQQANNTVASAGPAAVGAADVTPQSATATTATAPGYSFFISLGPSRELNAKHLAVGHVLSGFGALRQAALDHQDAAAAAPASVARGSRRCRIVACSLLPRGAPPPSPAPLMLGPWPAWPEDLPPLARPDMEEEARGRLDAARGIKAAGNAAHAAGDHALALAHYRQGVR